MRTIIIAGLAILIVACAGSPARLAMKSPEELQAANVFNLCNAYDNNRSAKIKAEIERRNSLTESEWRLVEQDKIQRGMSELALVCSWGAPGIWGDVNESVGSWGVHKQWVYRPCDTCSAQYVYTENGEVASWQN